MTAIGPDHVAALREVLTEICQRIEASRVGIDETFREVAGRRGRLLDAVYAIAEAALAAEPSAAIVARADAEAAHPPVPDDGLAEEAPPPWAMCDAPGQCAWGHAERQPQCPACHDMRIAAYEAACQPPAIDLSKTVWVAHDLVGRTPVAFVRCSMCGCYYHPDSTGGCPVCHPDQPSKEKE